VGRASGEPHHLTRIGELNRQDAKFAKGRGEKTREKEKSRENDVFFLSPLPSLFFVLALLASWRFNSLHFGMPVGLA
jgi:hypothetical protein